MNLHDLNFHSFLLKSFGAGILLAIGAGAFFAYLVGVSTADAHQATNIDGYPLGWVYPTECCNSAKTSASGDCAPIDSKYVTEGPDGYHINLPVGSHPKLKTKGYSGVVPYSVARNSPEGNYHICLASDGSHRYCFFAGARGF